jgi:hypothetical protein
MVTIVNNFPGEVTVAVNGNHFDLTAGQSVGPVAVTPSPSGNDSVGVIPVAVPTCGMGGANKRFTAGVSYQVTVTAVANACISPQGPVPGPVASVKTLG